MLSDIFEKFYANIRALQYLQFILHFNSVKQRFLPILMHGNNEVTLKTEVSNYYSKDEAINVLNRVLHSVIYSPKTYLYKINARGAYEKQINAGNKDVFEDVIERIKAKHYQDIQF